MVLLKIPNKVLQSITPPYQSNVSVLLNQYLCRTQPIIVIGGHAERVSAGIVYKDKIIFFHIGEQSIFRKNISGFADISNDVVKVFGSFRSSGQGLDLMIRIIEQRPDQNIESDVGPAVQMSGVFLYGPDSTQQSPAFR